MRWLIAGASNIAKEWVCQAIRAVGDEIVCVVTGDKSRGEVFAAELAIPDCMDDLAAALALPDVDAVYISSQNHLHYQQTIMALEAGKAVMCEKPIALNLWQARDMLRCAREHRRLLAVNHHLRNAGSIKKIRQLIADGVIGEVLTVNLRHAVSLPQQLQGWRVNDDAGGGVILDITVHDADTLRFILDDDPLAVTAMTQSGSMSTGNIPETVMGVMRFQRGTLVNFYDSFSAKYTQTGITIIGSEGTIQGNNVMTQQPVGDVFLINEQGCQQTDIVAENLYVNSFHCFKQAAEQNSSPAASAEDGLWSLKTALAVAESANSQQTVFIDKE